MKPTKINSHRNDTTYRFGKWLVSVTRSTTAGRSQCGLRRQTTASRWYAIDTGNPSLETSKAGSGGIRDAAAKLA